MLNIDELKFDENGLIPAIVVDAETGMQSLYVRYTRARKREVSS